MTEDNAMDPGGLDLRGKSDTDPMLANQIKPSRQRSFDTCPSCGGEVIDTVAEASPELLKRIAQEGWDMDSYWQEVLSSECGTCKAPFKRFE